MGERIMEFVESGPITKDRIDRAAGIIRGVKFLGAESRNPPPHNNSYPLEMRRASERVLEAAQIYVNHPPRDKGESTRPYQEKMGIAKNVRESGDGLVGDWHFPPKHSLAESVFWDAENNPNGLAFSINGEAGKIRFEGGRKVVESLATLHSIDLVTRGATTKSLFESEIPMNKTTPKAILEAITTKHKDQWRLDAKKLLEDDYAPMAGAPMDAPADGQMDTTAAGIDAMCTMLKAAASSGDWKKAATIVKAFEKLLSDKAPAADDTPPDDTTKEGLKVQATKDAIKKIQETFNLKLTVMAAEKVTPTPVLLKLLESAEDEKSIKEQITAYKTELGGIEPPRKDQKPKSGLPQKHTGKGVQESAITVPETALASGKALAEWCVD